MPKTSPQKRYANAVHVIARRAKVSYRTAQKIYRAEPDEAARKFPTHWRELTRNQLDKLKRDATASVYDARGQDRPFAFDAKRMEGDRIQAALTDSGLQRVRELEATFTVVVDGGDKKTVTVKGQDVSVKKDQFWYAVHELARDVLEDEISDGADYDSISIVLDSMRAV